ncbi:MAG: rhomboid family intramembrane serine protease [Thermoplasmatota archaeon]
MALLPPFGHPESLLAFGLVIAGCAVIVFRKDVPKAYGLGFLALIIFGIQTVSALFFGGDWIPDDLGFRTDLFFYAGFWWMPLTYMFVHADIAHIAGNLLVLLSAGPLLEDRIGGRAFLFVFFLTGFGAVGAHILMTAVFHLIPLYEGAIGASGAIFGVLTVLAWHFPTLEVPFPLFILVWLPAFAVLLLFLALNFAYMFTTTNIAWYGHFGGFLIGLGIAPWVRPLQGKASARSVADADALMPLATTPALVDIVTKLRATAEPDADPALAEAWLDRFFAKARCPTGHPLERRGFRAECQGHEYQIRFEKAVRRQGAGKAFGLGPRV